MFRACWVTLWGAIREFAPELRPRTSVSANVTVIEPLPWMAPEPKASAISRASSGLADSCRVTRPARRGRRGPLTDAAAEGSPAVSGCSAVLVDQTSEAIDALD